MDLFPIPLFPDGSLSSSVITTVWVGVMVVAFFNLRLGWVFSGLVIPGYMVPLLLVKPWSAGVVIMDGLITYFIVRFLSERPAFLPYWCSLFGRDRFFALLLVSVVIRLLLDGWVLPIMGEYINTQFGWSIDYRSDLHSFGLIIIALIANQFWKTGFARGLMPLLVTIGVTYIIVRYGLMELTNFSVGNLRFLYEDLAASVLASPKAYIIVLTTAFFASRMNLLYGWDYNGILIPSLLALQWYQPTKILTTFAEALVIFYIASVVLRTPLFTHVNMEGARKLLLFFNISFLMKFTLGYLLPQFWPDLKVTDTYGFGYLLATLIAIRMYDQDLMARLTRATLQTSISAVVAASVAGFALLSFGQTRAWLAEPQNLSSSADVILLPDARLSGRLQRDKVLLYQSDPQQLIPSALPQEVTRFTKSLQAISNYGGDDDDGGDGRGSLQRAAAELDAIGYELLLIDGRYAYMRERPPARGRGLFIIDTQAPSELILEVPAPVDEPGTSEAAGVLLRILGAKGLAIAGTRRNAKPDGSADSLQNRHTLFQIFHRTLARANAVQIRQIDTALNQGREAESAGNNSMWVRGALPADLDLVKLRNQTGGFDVRWEPPPFANVQRESSPRGFAELAISGDDLRRIWSHGVVAERDIKVEVQDLRIDGYLQSWLVGSKQNIAGRGTDAYQPPRLDELIYFDQEILSPLLAAIRRNYRGDDWTSQGMNALRVIDAAASAFGYEIIRYKHRRSKNEYIILAERDDTQNRRFWGTYVFRLDQRNNYIVQIPRPGFEQNSFEFGAALFERINAGALLIAGAHPDSNRDRSADVIQLRNMQSVFTLVHQVLLREFGVTPAMTIQSRALGAQTALAVPDADALLALSDGTYRREHAAPLTQALLEQLDADQLAVRLVDGSPQTAGYEVGFVPQLRYLEASENKVFANLWVSPLARASYRQQIENRVFGSQFSVLDIPTIDADLQAYVATTLTPSTQDQMSTQLSADLDRYVATHDLVTLQRIVLSWPEYHWLRVNDIDSQQTFVLVLDADRGLLAAVNLRPRHPQQVVPTGGVPIEIETVERFIATRAGKLVVTQR